ncbi:hypothetical protein FRACA_480008 [Frankia canadensis]|uniref:Uncharacterized protein n=1 Tax=Frankia canadensis TaxID=1836972 RepID=A0A2I2KXY4_9ACTN|nr:hypothetical protein FRACA_480008 [Frankia canadensis]SOU57809.1 hypothetical protein FRACA_480008 [Frankia canadensis]
MSTGDVSNGALGTRGSRAVRPALSTGSARLSLASPQLLGRYPQLFHKGLWITSWRGWLPVRRVGPSKLGSQSTCRERRRRPPQRGPLTIARACTNMRSKLGSRDSQITR